MMGHYQKVNATDSADLPSCMRAHALLLAGRLAQQTVRTGSPPFQILTRGAPPLILYGESGAF